jgi:hypothetical protein
MLMEIWAGAKRAQHRRPIVRVAKARAFTLDVISPPFWVVGIGSDFSA